MNKQASRRRIKKRLLLGVWVDKYDIVRCGLESWLRQRAYDLHDVRASYRLRPDLLDPPFRGRRYVEGVLVE